MTSRNGGHKERGRWERVAAIFAVKVVTSSLSKFVYNRCHNQALVTTHKTEEYEVI